MPEMIITRFSDNKWSKPEFVPSDSLTLHPGAHVLHYASTCFEGLKAFRHADGSVKIFRMDQNVNRFEQSSRLLALPAVDKSMLAQMIIDVVAKFKDKVPQTPGSMYIRPTHIGTEAAIGKAASPSLESLMYVLLTPVGDYFSSDVSLRLVLDDVGMRCAPDNGMIKSGGNYASALNICCELNQNTMLTRYYSAHQAVLPKPVQQTFYLLMAMQSLPKRWMNHFSTV